MAVSVSESTGERLVRQRQACSIVQLGRWAPAGKERLQ